MEEKNLSTCKRCLEKKMRIQDGKYGNSRNKRWKDDEGKFWRGHVCPTCHKQEMKDRMTAKRVKSETCEAQ